MDKRLLNYLEEHVRETSRQSEGLREENAQQLASLHEEFTRRIASLRSEMIQRLERLDTSFRQSRLELDELRNDNDGVTRQVDILYESLSSLSNQATTQYLEMRESAFNMAATIRSLESRVSALETQAVKEGRDPMAGVRQVLAKYRDRPPS